MNARSARKAVAAAAAVALAVVGTTLTGPVATALADDGCGTGETWSQQTGDVVIRPAGRGSVRTAVYLVYKSSCEAAGTVTRIREAVNKLALPQKVGETGAIVATLSTFIVGPVGVLAGGTGGFTMTALIEREKVRLNTLANRILEAKEICGNRGILYRAAFDANGLTYSVSGLACQPSKNKDLDPGPDPDLSHLGAVEFDLVLLPEPDSPGGTRCDTDEFYGRYPNGTPWGETFLRDRFVGATATGRLYQRDLWNVTNGAYEPDGPPFEDCRQDPPPPTGPSPEPTPPPTTTPPQPEPEPTVVPGPDPTPAPTTTPAPRGLSGPWQLCREWFRQDGSSLYSGCSGGTLSSDGSLAFGSSSGCRTSAWFRNGREFTIEAAGCTTAGWDGDYALSWRGSISDSENTITGSIAATGGPATSGIFTLTR